jgi:hypothetical protein
LGGETWICGNEWHGSIPKWPFRRRPTAPSSINA